MSTLSAEIRTYAEPPAPDGRRLPYAPAWWALDDVPEEDIDYRSLSGWGSEGCRVAVLVEDRGMAERYAPCYGGTISEVGDVWLIGAAGCRRIGLASLRGRTRQLAEAALAHGPQGDDAPPMSGPAARR